MSQRLQVLVVEKDERTSRMLRRAGSEHQVYVERVADVEAARSSAIRGAYDVIVLDTSVGRDARALCQQLRQRGVKTPILVLATQSMTGTLLSALLAGADDFVLDPFTGEQLLAYVCMAASTQTVQIA